MNPKLKATISLNNRKRLGGSDTRFLYAAIIIACAMAIAAATVIGCGWGGGNERSVRFSSRTAREFGRLPPLPIWSDGEATNEGRAFSESYEEDYAANQARAEQRSADVDRLWNDAANAEERGDLAAVRSSLSEFLERTTTARDSSVSGSTSSQANRNSAIDRLDALTALDAGSPVTSVRAYLNARRIYDNDNSIEDARRALAAVLPDGNLRDNVEYLIAALLYREERKQEAARAWNRLVARYPRSEKREAALFMAAVTTMKQSCGFSQTSGDPEHLRATGGTYRNGQHVDPSPHSYQPCRDGHWNAARTLFTRLLAEYPRGRYRNDAHGWLAHLYSRGGDRALALAEYYRLLGDETDRSARSEAVFSLRLVRPYASDDEMRRVEAEIEDEPQPALAYCYHNLYNFAAYVDYGVSYDYPSNRLEERARETAQQRERMRIAQFAARLMRRYPRADFSAGFAVRAAQANIEAGDDRAAYEFATRALNAGARGETRLEALWVKGFSEHRTGDQAAARRTLNTLITEDARRRFTEGARRLLAMAAEDGGDIEAALEQYIALDYATDIAYFVDVLMTPEQLASFIEHHPAIVKRDELLYALGVRFMRAGRFAEAREAYAQVRTSEAQLNYYDSGNSPCGDQPCSAKNPLFDGYGYNEERGVRARWVLHDLQLMRDIEALQRAHDEAIGDEAKAETLYQLASRIYESSTLLFYNPAAWQGGRYHSLSYIAYRAPNEAEIVWRHAQEHETMARAAVLFQEVARRYPQTRAAREALYTAAVCDERLSNFNPYWHDVYAGGLHAGERRVNYAHVRATYPRYQLPRGTYSWQPSTRTANGGAGWSSPPPRPRRLTRSEQARSYVAAAWGHIVTFWHERGRGWLNMSLLFIYLPSVLLIVMQTRGHLRCEIERGSYHPSRQWRNVWGALSAEGRTPRERHDAACVAILDALKDFGQFAILDRRGRAAFALNTVAHALLLWLAYALWRALFSS